MNIHDLRPAAGATLKARPQAKDTRDIRPERAAVCVRASRADRCP